MELADLMVDPYCGNFPHSWVQNQDEYNYWLAGFFSLLLALWSKSITDGKSHRKLLNALPWDKIVKKKQYSNSHRSRKIYGKLKNLMDLGNSLNWQKKSISTKMIRIIPMIPTKTKTTVVASNELSWTESSVA